MTETEWLEWRGRGIGASDIAGILDISPWQSPYSVWASKVLSTNAGDSGNAEAMRWGRLLENEIIAEAAKRLGVEAFGYQTRCEHRDYSWARATVDSFCRDEGMPNQPGVIEAKNTGEAVWHSVPEYYEAQVLWQLEVTGCDYGWVAALHNGRKLSLWEVKAQPDLQARMIQTAKRFWDSFVLTGIAPMIDGKSGTADALAAFYRESDPDSVIAIDEHAATIEALERVRNDEKSLASDRSALENQIKSVLGRHETGTVNGVPVVSWKAQRQRRINLEMVRQRDPKLAADCETVTEFRRFTVKGLAKSREEI